MFLIFDHHDKEEQQDHNDEPPADYPEIATEVVKKMALPILYEITNAKLASTVLKKWKRAHSVPTNPQTCISAKIYSENEQRPNAGATTRARQGLSLSRTLWALPRKLFQMFHDIEPSTMIFHYNALWKIEFLFFFFFWINDHIQHNIIRIIWISVQTELSVQ